ncbi:MAG: CRISPR-associated helicase Cas3' [Thermoplasmata archaeon]
MDNIIWDDPFKKESHPNKCLYRHIDEVRRIFERFIEFYEIRNESIYKIIREVIDHHDDGKLHHEWQWNIENRITHSDKSAERYLDNKQSLNQEDFLIALLILKHHSRLSPQPGFEKFKKLGDSFSTLEGPLRQWFFKSFPFEERVMLADAYGFFKLADCLSASGDSSFLPEKPDIELSNFEKLLGDEKRRKEQENIMRLGKVGFLRAPTGWGKTMASPFYFVNKNINKGFFMFPTITAINNLYDKFTRIFGDKIEKYFYFYDFEIEEKNIEKIDATRKLFWSKHFLKPYMITSVDQFLLSFLQIGTYHMKRPLFRNSAIILDEIHLLNNRMMYLLLHFLGKFQEIYNFHILFMSATLPDGLKKVIEERLEIKADEKSFLDKANLLKDICRINIEYRDSPITDDNVIQEIVEKGKSHRVLVLCNTVETAVKVKKKIEEMKGVDSVILHARFTYKSRKEIEEKLSEFKQPHVFVSTQVCEVSLDISYDKLYTELAPIPSLIQRCGRVNRYEKSVDGTNVYVFEPEIKNEKYYPYEKEELDSAKTMLNEIGELKNEYQLFEKLNEIYTAERISDGISKAEKELRMETMFENETKTGYFFSLDLTEDEVKKIVSYRESFTTLIIPSGPLIYPTEEGVRMREEIEVLCRKFEIGEDVEGIIAKLKGYAVPAPVYSVYSSEVKKMGLPVIEKAGDFIYHPNYGFVNQKLISNNILR